MEPHRQLTFRECAKVVLLIAAFGCLAGVTILVWHDFRSLTKCVHDPTCDEWACFVFVVKSVTIVGGIAAAAAAIIGSIGVWIANARLRGRPPLTSPGYGLAGALLNTAVATSVVVFLVVDAGVGGVRDHSGRLLETLLVIWSWTVPLGFLAGLIGGAALRRYALGPKDGAA